MCLLVYQSWIEFLIRDAMKWLFHDLIQQKTNQIPDSNGSLAF